MDKFLASRNVIVEEGYIGEKQSQLILKALPAIEEIKFVLEIGFNAGHSALFFLKHLSKMKLFLSCDICDHNYCEPIAKELETSFSGIFHFLKGKSSLMLQAFYKTHPHLKFDLIFIDGSHEFMDVFLDILYSKQLCHEKTIVLIDDYHSQVKEAVDIFVMLGYLKIINNFETQESDGSMRCWIEAKFM